MNWLIKEKIKKIVELKFKDDSDAFFSFLYFLFTQKINLLIQDNLITINNIYFNLLNPNIFVRST